MEAVIPFLLPLGKSLLLTLFYFALGAAGSLLLGLPLALGMQLKQRPLRYIAIAYTEIFRNTPLLVQLFWLHFALPSFTGVRLTVEQTAGIAIVIVMTAYMGEVYRGAIGSVSNGQREAASALGLHKAKAFVLIILPQAVATAMPAIGNTMVSLLKATAVLSILGVPELMRMTSRISDYSAKPVLFYSIAAVIYIACGLALAWGIKLLEQRMTRWRIR